MTITENPAVSGRHSVLDISSYSDLTARNAPNQALPLLMKKPITLTLFASLLLASFVSVNAQETAGALPVKASVNDSSPASTPERQSTDIYRVGVGDVLDIRLNSTNNRSTLFTVIEDGVIDIPLAGGVISVVGRTPEEIQNVISAELKRRAVDENRGKRISHLAL